MAVKIRKKLIEVALPLDAINAASAREKSIRHGHPSTLHLWWARRPLAAARAVIFAQMVDDPSSWPDLFPTEKKQEKERERLFRIIEELVKWENTTNEAVLDKARAEIWASWRRACADNADHPRARELFDRDKLPAFHDPFAGGGTLPLEAQRLGLKSYASDLNPVAILINKATIEIPPKFANRSPINPSRDPHVVWKGAQGLADDLRYYGRWMRDEAEKRIGHLYPKVEITSEMARERPDLAPLVGQKLTVIAWLWTRTVKSPNPAYSSITVPLASTFVLSTKVGKEAYIDPVVNGGQYTLLVRVGTGSKFDAAKRGTRAPLGQDFSCLVSGVPIPRTYVRQEAKAGRMGQKLIAIVAEGPRGRLYIQPTAQDEELANSARLLPAVEEARATFLAGSTPTRAMITGGVCSAYGLTTHGDLYLARQLAILTTLSDLVEEVRLRVRQDAKQAGLPEKPHKGGELSAADCGDAIAIYMALAVSRQANRSATLNFWDNAGENVQQVFGRQAFAMTWDFVEGNPFSESTGNFFGQFEYIVRFVRMVPAEPFGAVMLADAQTQEISRDKVVSTDPPYYDNINYADLSDFFYNWLRRSAKGILPELFSTLSVPKAEELVAIPFRHGGKQQAEAFFLSGMTQAMRRLAGQAHTGFPVTIYYAFKQSETQTDAGTSSTGWETFLDAVVQAGFGISGTWPVRTELTGNLKKKVGALASSIVLVCHPRAPSASETTRREFSAALKAELPQALRHLQRGNIAPVDLAQASIGPGMAVYTRYSRVLDAEGKTVSVREALALINQILDETLAEQEGDLDTDSRFALTWFEQYAFGEGEFGVADVLARAKVTSVQRLVDAGVLETRRNQVRLLEPAELPADWDPRADPHRNVWRTMHQLLKSLEAGGETAAASLVVKLGSKAEGVRELAYRLYVIAERKKHATEALSYNGLVKSWPEISRLAQENAQSAPAQGALFAGEER